MKILIVSNSFYPSISPRAHRTTELAKEFSRQGHEVTVLTPKLDEHVEFEKFYHLIVKDLGKQRWKKIDFGNSKPGKLLTRAFSRFFSLVFEYPDIELIYLVNKTLKKEKGYDLLISIAFPHPIHWGVASIWKGNQKIASTWIADCGDPYMGSDTDSFKKLFYFKYIEKWWMRKVDHVTIPIDSARHAYYEEFYQKIHVIPQGFSFDQPEIRNTPTKNKVPTFAYAGGFIPNRRDPRPFLKYLSTLDNDFQFIVYTNNHGLINDYHKLLGSRLIVNPYVPREELILYLKDVDFLVNFDNNTQTALPSKLIDYAIAGRPILNIKQSLDSEEFQRFLCGNYTTAMKIENINRFHIRNVCEQFLNLYNN
jgi:glycosyltransferase involved in cell wall biosynthesis